MEDVVLQKVCAECEGHITLMESCRVSEDEPNADTYLVERCLHCGQHKVVEVARLHESQKGLNPGDNE